MIKRDDIPLGQTYDANGKMLTYKDGSGYWEEYTRDALGNDLTCKDGTGYWHEYTRDALGNVLTYKNSTGYWKEYTRDAKGNDLTFKVSTGFWCEFTRDALGNELTFTNKTGKWITLVEINNYTLRTKNGKYWAGCREFDNAEQALKHWDRDDDRACLFTVAIGTWENGK
jgi:YD repeat-containing protein